MRIKNISLLLIISTFIFTGCSTKTINEEDTIIGTFHTIEQDNNENITQEYLNQNNLDNISYLNHISQKNKISEELLDFYQEWKGVKYRFGGYTKKGIDCSALVQKALLEKFDFLLPRTTKNQVLVGTPVNKQDLQVGDLIFFKNGRTRHVGIYIDDGKFIHASRKVGVTISELDNTYFKKRYWKAQRVLE